MTRWRRRGAALGLAALTLLGGGCTAEASASAPAPSPSPAPLAAEPPRPWPPEQGISLHKRPRTVAGRVWLVGGVRGRTREYSLPVPDSTVTRRDLAAPHHDYPAADLMVPTGTPFFAPHAGRVLVHQGARCGLGITLLGRDRHRYVACHLSVVSVHGGANVRAGDVLGLTGDTGNAKGAPHLHLQVRSPAGALVCPQPALLAWLDGRDVAPAAAGHWGSCTFAR